MSKKSPLSKQKAKRQIKPAKNNEIEVVSSPEIKTPVRRGIKFYLFVLVMVVFNGFTYSYWLTNIFDDDAPKTPNTQAKNLPSPTKKAKSGLPPDFDLPPQNAPIDRGYNASSGQFPPGALPPGVSLPGITSYNPTMPGRTTQQGYGANDGIRQNFTGQIRDTESSLLYYGARYYNPQHGRFTSVDPENAGANPEDPQSWNGYAYARNNPLKYSDPDGREYKVCNREGQCWTHDDDPIRKAKEAGDVSFVGSRNSRTGLDSGVILDSEGNELGTYQQTSHDNPIQRLVWGSARTLDIFTPIIELVQPVPLPGGSALPKLFKTGNAIRKTLPVLQRICFVAGTPILTENGLKPIEEVRKGDKILSYDEKTKQTEYKMVTQTTVRFAEPGRILSVKVEGETESLGVTGEHPFYVRIYKARNNIAGEDDEGEWIEAKNLQIGDEIRKANGTWAKVQEITQRSEGAKVYNFEVTDNHNYFVGNQGLLAHNQNCQALFNAVIKNDRNGLTWIGRALQKHSDRAGSAFRTSARNPKAYNQAGEELAEEILTNPSARYTPNRLGGTDVRLPDGRGIRFDGNGSPYSLLEP